MNALFETRTRTLNDFPSDSTIYSLEFHDNDIGYFSPAFGFTSKNGDLHEIEISRISIGTSRVDSLKVLEHPNFRSFTLRGDDIYNLQLALRYEYIFNLRKSKQDAAFKPYIGISAQPYFRHMYFRSSQSTVFPYSFTDVGLIMAVVPRLIYNINSSWFLDLNVPIAAYRINWTRDEFSNPQIPIEDRVSNEISTESFAPIYHVRMGAGLRF